MPGAGIFGNLLAQQPRTPESFIADRQANEASGLTNALSAAKLDEYQQGLLRDSKLRNMLASGAGSDQLIQGGFLKEGMDLSKNKADVGNINSQEASHRVKAFADKAAVMRSSIGSVPNPQAAARYMQQAFADPDMGPVMKQFGTLEEALSEIPNDPNGFRNWQMQASEGIGKLADHAMKQQEFGLKQNQFGETVRHNKSTEGTAAGQLSVARQRLTLDQQAPKGQYDAERGVLVDPRTGEARPVTMDGQPLGAKDKPLNDSQSKALLFGSRMQAANKVLADLEKTGTSASVPGSRTPIIGGIISAAQGANQQSLDQAKRDFMTAILRRESGASISPTEFDTADKQYFPQIGDSKQVIAQKAANRKLAIDGVLIEVPEKARGSLSNPSQQSGPKPGAVEDGHRFKGGDPSNPSNWEKVK